jgi:hypothetical protein
VRRREKRRFCDAIYYAKTRIFAKTGSGQTSEKAEEKEVFSAGKSKEEMGDDIVEWARMVLPPFVPGAENGIFF